MMSIFIIFNNTRHVRDSLDNKFLCLSTPKLKRSSFSLQFGQEQNILGPRLKEELTDSF